VHYEASSVHHSAEGPPPSRAFQLQPGSGLFSPNFKALNEPRYFRK
jgi:hypothetical protein